MRRLQLVSQMSDLTVGHGQPAGALLQVSLQPGAFFLHTAYLSSQMSGVSLNVQKKRQTLKCCSCGEEALNKKQVGGRMHVQRRNLEALLD